MKQVFLFGSVLIVVAIIAGFLMRPGKEEGVPVTSSSTSTNMFVLYRISGEVFYRKDGDNTFTAMNTEKIDLPNKTTVKTTTGKASALLSDKSVISIKENTEILIEESEKGFSIMQFFGKTYHRVETVLTGKNYEVRTPTTLAAVRGTKFFVGYDLTTKETKVAVTESIVLVKEIDSITSTSTIIEDDKETILVEEGKTATLQESKDPKRRNEILISDTEKDEDINEFLKDETALDEVYDDIKKTENKEEFKKKIEEVIRKEKEESKKETETTTKDEPKEVTTKEELVKRETQIINEETQDDREESIVKISEEAFFSQFEPLFIKLFYVDDVGTPCLFRGTPEQRVKEVAEYARISGYPLTSTIALTSFAKEIATYCVSKDKTLGETLKRRFDQDYPYQQ